MGWPEHRILASLLRHETFGAVRRRRNGKPTRCPSDCIGIGLRFNHTLSGGSCIRQAGRPQTNHGSFSRQKGKCSVPTFPFLSKVGRVHDETHTEDRRECTTGTRASVMHQPTLHRKPHMRCVSREIYRYIRPGTAPSRNPHSQRCSVEALLSYPQLLHALSQATRRAQGRKIRPFVNLWQENVLLSGVGADMERPRRN